MYITKLVTTVKCIPWLDLGNNNYLLKKEECCWRCRGEKFENEYKDCLHKLYIKDCICAIDKKNVGYDKRLLREQYKNQTLIKRIYL